MLIGGTRMAILRLKADLWVMAYVRTCNSAGAPTFVVRRGDEHAGSIFIRITHLDGNSELYGPAAAGLAEVATDRRWSRRSLATDSEIEALIKREIDFDPDIWLIEVEDRQGRHFLDEWLISD